MVWITAGRIGVRKIFPHVCLSHSLYSQSLLELNQWKSHLVKGKEHRSCRLWRLLQPQIRAMKNRGWPEGVQRSVQLFVFAVSFIICPFHHLTSIRGTEFLRSSCLIVLCFSYFQMTYKNKQSYIYEVWHYNWNM